jgi:hypothetical protein
MAVISTATPGDAALRGILRHAAVVGVAGLIAGFLVGGLGGRIVMRVAAMTAPGRVDGILTESGATIGDITAPGTIALFIFVGGLAGAFGGIMYLLTEPWLAWTGRLQPLAFAAVLTALAGHTAIVPDNVDFAILRNRELNVAMFLALFPIYALTLSGLRPLVEDRVARLEASGDVDVMLFAVPVAFGGLLVPVMFVQYLVEDACGCAPAPALAALIALGGIATLATWLFAVRGEADRRWSLTVRLVGHAALAGAVVLGALRLTSDVRELV